MTTADLGLVPRPGPCAHGVTGGSHCSMCAAAALRDSQRKKDLVDFVEMYARSCKVDFERTRPPHAREEKKP